MFDFIPAIKICASLMAIVSLGMLFMFGMADPLRGFSGNMIYIWTSGVVSSSVCVFLGIKQRERGE